jgi:hypothetical protein
MEALLSRWGIGAGDGEADECCAFVKAKLRFATTGRQATVDRLGRMLRIREGEGA